MIELLGLFKDFTPGAYGIWTLVVLIAGWFMREWRENRKLSIDDRLAKRDGYAKQVATLTAENRDLRQEVADVRREAREAVSVAQKEQDEYRRLCQEETDQLRNSLRYAMDELAGIKRAISAGTLAALEAVPHDLVPAVIQAAANRAEEALRNRP